MKMYCKYLLVLKINYCVVCKIKLLLCVKLFFIIDSLNQTSHQFHNKQSFTLYEENDLQHFIPPRVICNHSYVFGTQREIF